MRRLQLRGSHAEATRFGQDALQVWRERLGPDDLQVLTLAVEVAIAMRSDAHAADARELILSTLRMLRERYGEDHEVDLAVRQHLRRRLRSRGQLAEALELDLSLLPRFDRVFGADHHRTLNVRNNIAADYRRLGPPPGRPEEDQKTSSDRRRILGSDDPITLDLARRGGPRPARPGPLSGIAGYARARWWRDSRPGGRPENLDWLNARKSFAAALRKAGYHWDALQESEDVVQRYRDYLGMDHTYTLRAAANLINDRRAVGELARAEELGREVLDRCQASRLPVRPGLRGAGQPGVRAACGGRAEEARRYDLQARDGLVDAYGDVHPFTLEATINYASDLAACGDLAAAIRAGQDTLARCRTRWARTTRTP